MHCQTLETKTMKLRLQRVNGAYDLTHTDLVSGDEVLLKTDSDLDVVMAVWDRQVELDKRVK